MIKPVTDRWYMCRVSTYPRHFAAEVRPLKRLDIGWAVTDNQLHCDHADYHEIRIEVLFELGKIEREGDAE